MYHVEISGGLHSASSNVGGGYYHGNQNTTFWLPAVRFHGIAEASET